MRFRHTPDMGEISGSGGGYEQCCQDMLEAGVKWLDRRAQEGRKPDLKAHSFKNIYGVMIADSDDAKEMEAAVMAVPSVKELGATGAMHQAVMSRLFWIAKNGWDAYCAELRKDEAAERASGLTSAESR